MRVIPLSFAKTGKKMTEFEKEMIASMLQENPRDCPLHSAIDTLDRYQQVIGGLVEKSKAMQKDYEEAVRYADDQIEQLEREKAKLERELRQYKAIRVSAVRQKDGFLMYNFKYAYTQDSIFAATMHVSADRPQFINDEQKDLTRLESVAYRISMHLRDLFTYEEALSLLISRIKDLGYDNDVAIEIEDRFYGFVEKTQGRLRIEKSENSCQIAFGNIVLPKVYHTLNNVPNGNSEEIAMGYAIEHCWRLEDEADKIAEKIALETYPVTEEEKDMEVRLQAVTEEQPVTEEDDHRSPEQAWENFKNGIKAMQKLCRDLVKTQNSNEVPLYRFPIYPSSVPSWNCYEVAWGEEDDERDFGDGKPTKKDIIQHPESVFLISFKFVDPSGNWPDKIVEAVFNSGRWEAEVREGIYSYKDSTPFKLSKGEDYWLEGQK